MSNYKNIETNDLISAYDHLYNNAPAPAGWETKCKLSKAHRNMQAMQDEICARALAADTAEERKRIFAAIN